MKKYGLVVHGGAGITRTTFTAEEEQAVRKKIEEVLLEGKMILEKGGSSLEAVEKVVQALEDDPLFNAGKGSVFNSAGKIEMDAAIMDGSSGKVGAVAAVKQIRNPISAARLVMEKTPHVLLCGTGAEDFARAHKLPLEDPSYFFTKKRWEALQREKKILLPSESNTVGAVSLDKNGNLAAATSTGGKTNKLPGRIGDSAIAGAGTFARNGCCAVSGTGDGEYFIRFLSAYDVCALMQYRGFPLSRAAEQVIQKITDAGGRAGLIAIDPKGNIAMPFNTEGMTRGYLNENGKPVVKIFKE